jgi:alpha-ketoglutaric semialdehyde dehydrogenase
LQRAGLNANRIDKLMSENIQTGEQFIGGQRSAIGDVSCTAVASANGASYSVDFFTATEQEITAAVHAAATAYGKYRQTSAIQRAEFLDAIAAELDALGDDFIVDVMRETALPRPRIENERTRTSNQLRLFSRVLRRGDFYSARIDTARTDLRQYRIGLGPVAVFGAGNFPLAFSVAGGDTASALAAGCPVVVKAHSGHMVTSAWVGSAIERAIVTTGMPAGTFNMVFGDWVGGRLVQEPGIKAVGFTGSLQGGRALIALAAARQVPIPVFAEMSSVNPVLVLPNALAARASTIAQELAASVLLSCGQLCTCPGLIVGVRSKTLSKFIEFLASAMAAHKPQTMLNAGIANNYWAGIARLKALRGIRLVAGSGAEGVQATPHLFVADADLLFDSSRPLEVEVFGPATIVAEVEDEKQLLQFAEAMQGQLTCTVLAEPDEIAGGAELLARLEENAGRLLVNSYPTGVEVCDAIVHGGPYPAASDSRSTSVGSGAIDRFLRPLCYQNYSSAMLPPALQDENPLRIARLVNGEWNRGPIGASPPENMPGSHPTGPS